MTESARPRRWAIPQNHDLHRQRQEGTGPPGTGSGGIFGQAIRRDAWLEEHKDDWV